MTYHVTAAARERCRSRPDRVIADFLAGRSVADMAARWKMRPDHIARLLRSKGFYPKYLSSSRVLASIEARREFILLGRKAARRSENARLRAALAEREAA